MVQWEGEWIDLEMLFLPDKLSIIAQLPNRVNELL
jgi:hypothetical protein